MKTAAKKNTPIEMYPAERKSANDRERERKIRASQAKEEREIVELAETCARVAKLRKHISVEEKTRTRDQTRERMQKTREVLTEDERVL